MRKKDKNTLIFKIPKVNHSNKYKFSNLEISLEKHSSKKNLINKPKNTIFAVLDGGLVDLKKQYLTIKNDNILFHWRLVYL